MLQHDTDEFLQVKRCLDHTGTDVVETQLKHTVKVDTDSVLAMNGNHKVFVYGTAASKDQRGIVASSVKVSQPDQMKEVREAKHHHAPAAQTACC